MALQAGIDLVLISHQYARQQAGLGAIRAAVQSGQLSRARLSGAVERVLNLKKRFLSWETLWDVSELSVVGSESHKQLRDRAYERSTTLVCDDAGLLPLHLKADQQLLVIYPQPGQQTLVEDRQYPHAFLVELLRERHTHLKAIAFPSQATRDDYQVLDQEAEQSGAVIIVTVNAYLDRRQSELVQRLARSGRPVIGLAVYSPYDLLTFPRPGTYLVTYEYTEPALAAAFRVLFGEIQPQGRLPVRLV